MGGIPILRVKDKDGKTIDIPAIRGPEGPPGKDGSPGKDGAPGKDAPQLQELAQLIYPVGSIYMTVNEASPEMLFGGTWERIKDTFLLAAGDVYAAGRTGGEAEHTLTVDEIPKHTHNIQTRYSKQIDSQEGYQGGVQNYRSVDWWETQYVATELGGGGNQPHNIMPPYMTVYMWKRTA